ncbi:MAG: hypothetical protein MK066_04860 [Crocinitomicaceae bacterium]|nr:hypothetical protein [Crocinitomicaceae bacterium]
MKFVLTTALIAFSSIIYSQKSEDLVPKDAVSVFSINNVNLLQKISLDELVKYEFMEELQQELFDGSTSGLTLKESGVDFNQRLNIFQGKSSDFSITGFTFGIIDRNRFFEVFDDYEEMLSQYQGVDFYKSFFNQLAIKGNSAILFRVSPDQQAIDAETDSIWYARGNSYPWNFEDYNWMREESIKEGVVDSVEAIDFFDEMEIEEHTSTPIDALPIAEEDPIQKNYYELRDSIENVRKSECIKRVTDELFIDNETLMQVDPAFGRQLNNSAEGAFYLDNSRNYRRSADLWSLPGLSKTFVSEFQELYEGNLILGNLMIQDNSIDLILDVNYGEKLGAIYTEMTDSKLDKNIFQYIHNDNDAFFTYTINLRKAYEKTFEIMRPILEKDPRLGNGILLSWELLDEFINKDALFDTYQGSMFGTYNGIQKIKTKKIVFDYSEDDFNYTTREVEAEEDMPVFALGFTTKRGDIPENIMTRLSNTFPELTNKGKYWVLDNAVLNSAPMYFIVQNGLFIITNDNRLATEYPNGFGKNALNKRVAKTVRKSGIMYGYADLGHAIEKIPTGIFTDSENEMINVIRGKSGTMEIKSSETTTEKTTMNISYSFDGETDNFGTYILDLINSLYVVTK